MASNGTIAHRFANNDYNFEKGLKGSSVSISGRNYYSYGTVFGQWVDDKVCIVYWGSTSMTSNKHKLSPSDFPKDVTLLPYDDGGHGGYYNSWHGCDLLGWRGEFNFDKRAELIDYYVHEIYTSLKAIVDGKKKGLDTQAERTISEYWGYVMKLCALYRDTTISKWLSKKRIDLDGEWKLKKRLVRELDAQNMSVSSLVDIVFGEGTWQAYYDYCARYRKTADNKAKMCELCNRIGIKNPYRSGYWSDGWKLAFTVDEIRKMSAKERNEIHFAALMNKEWREGETERKKKRNRNSDNAYRWITGYNPRIKSSYDNSYCRTINCRNMYTGQEYELPKDYVYGFYWAKTSVEFDYDKFRKADDKEQWIRSFYAECEEVQDNCKALEILKRVGAHTREKQRSYDDDRYIDDYFLRENTTDEEYALCKKFIAKQEKHYADEEAQRRAAEIARLQREEEERKEREYMEQVKQEQIVECLKDGSEGCRNLWRKHLSNLHDSEASFNEASVVDKDGDFFYGGNVLLRFNLNKDKVETSKNIKIPVDTCKKMWRIVSKWHENPSSFKPMQIDTKGNGKYTISSYDNDILTAGCHDIAYAEMERMYNEIIELENEAA